MACCAETGPARRNVLKISAALSKPTDTGSDQDIRSGCPVKNKYDVKHTDEAKCKTSNACYFSGESMSETPKINVSHNM